MKKLLVLMLALLVSSAIQAQESKSVENKKSFFAFHAGPSFPVGDFASTNMDNEEAGMAKTGFTLGLNFGYRITDYVGIESAVFYNRFKGKDTKMTIDVGDGTRTVDLTLDDWNYYGISVGPSLEFKLTDKISTGMHVMGGIANVRLPAFYLDDEDLTKADWSIAPVVQGGINLKMDAGKQVFFFVNGEYQYMRPEFTLFDYIFEESEKVRQKIASVNVTAGIGIRF